MEGKKERCEAMCVWKWEKGKHGQCDMCLGYSKREG